MKSIVCLLCCVIIMAMNAVGQSCTHTSLSASFIFKTEAKRFKQADSSMDSCIVSISLIDKRTRKQVQIITFSSTYFFKDAFTNCNSARSYSTEKNKDAAVPDFDYGDLIVADFNFDGNDDFAVKIDSGGNRGPLYRFYMQRPNGTFTLSRLLTERMRFFPNSIKTNTRTLTLRSTKTGWHYQTDFLLEANTGKWTEINHKPLRVN